jgi:hypothetical protein
MKNNFLQYIILYVLVASVALVIATLVRIFATSIGFDSFTVFMVFIVALAIQLVAYLSIHVFLQELMLPWIGRGLSKIPYLRNKVKSTVPTKEVPESTTKQEPILSLDDIRNEQLQNKAKEEEEQLNVALDYTRKTFSTYVSDEHIELLSNNVKIYADKLSWEPLRPIKTSKELSTIDASHFGWNIWNHFRVGKQIDIACFLKKVFPDILKDVEVETIKRHLKDDELKGIIKICESFSHKS